MKRAAGKQNNFEDGHFSFLVRHATSHGADANSKCPEREPDDTDQIEKTLRHYYRDRPEFAERMVKEWDFLKLHPHRLAKIQKVVEMCWAENSSTTISKHRKVAGCVVAAWVTKEFAEYAEDKGKAGEPAFLHEFLEGDPLESEESIRESNSDGSEFGGVRCWVLFLARGELSGVCARLVRQHLYSAIESEIIGWNVYSIYLQVYGEHRTTATSYGFLPIGGDNGNQFSLMRVTKNEVTVANETLYANRLFSWKSPIYSLTMTERRIALLALRGLSNEDIGVHCRRIGYWQGESGHSSKVSKHLASIKQKIVGTNASIQWDEVLEHLRYNLWELRPYPNEISAIRRAKKIIPNRIS